MVATTTLFGVSFCDIGHDDDSAPLLLGEQCTHTFSVLALKRRYIDTTEVGQREAQLRGNMSNVGNGTTLSECIKASPPSPAAAVP